MNLYFIYFPIILYISSISSYAQTHMNIGELATKQDTKSLFDKMIGGARLPSWVTQGGSDSRNLDVSLIDDSYTVYNSCKPNDCSSEIISVMYSKNTGKMIGVFSESDTNSLNQQLKWLVGSNELSIDEKAVLFASLTGSLANHPEGYRFKQFSGK